MVGLIGVSRMTKTIGMAEVTVLSEGLSALASAGGTAVVAAMVNDGWAEARRAVARVFGRDDPAEIEQIEERLERDRAELAKLTDGELERARAERETAWRTRLADLLESAPGTEAQLRDWLSNAGSSPAVSQYVTGRDNAQQATLGSGVQHVTFHGSPHG